MEERKIIGRLLIISRDELTFLEKGYSDNMPDYVKQECKEIRASMRWLENKVNEINVKEFGVAENV